jgi:hypothetical protein
MIICKQLVDDAFIEIHFADEAGDLHGAKVTYSLDGQSYQPCVIYRGLDADSLLECTFWKWNQAVHHGNLKFNGPPHPVYWHLYLNGMHQHTGPVHLRVEALRGNEVVTWNTVVDLRPSRAIFLNDWKTYVGNQPGWKVQGDSLTVESKVDASPIQIPTGVTGCYDVYLGIGYGILYSLLKISDEPIRYPFLTYGNRVEFQDKAHKEIHWKTVELQEGSQMEIGLIPTTVREPRVCPFGSIRYIKLVPARKKTAVRSQWADKKLALYFEPYSWAFNLGLQDRWRVREALSLYREMGANELHNQVLRFGSQSMHHSRIVEHHDKGAALGDEGIYSSGPAEMVKSLDVLRESIDICRELGLTHYANAGLTACYPGTDLEDRISREHPDWRDGEILRFNRPETRAYAAGIVREFIEWGTDGVTIDCMRYPYHHTEEDLVALFTEIHKAIIEQAAGRTVPLTVRIPYGDITYFRAFERLARQGIVQCVIPSGLFQRESWLTVKPYLKWQDYGCRIYGLIDGWLNHLGTLNGCQVSLNRNPRNIREDITRFFNEGADGIFVYQADLHMADPFTRMIYHWNNWPTGGK